jgi:uncharacterized membrane protein YtjA (UPF0391 family)
MKGLNMMEIVMAMIGVVVVISVLMVRFIYVKEVVGESAPTWMNMFLPAGLVLDAARRRKGIVLTTTLLATIVFVVIVAMLLIFIFMSLQAEAGSSTGGFFYNMFDSIMKGLPMVS